MFEVNLVPDLKHEAIKALRMRNIILFVCIVASALSVLVIFLLLGIKGGQDITMASQDNKTSTLSSKLNAFSDLAEMLTIQDQLSNLDAISGEKTAMSRIFGLLVTMQDRGEDTVKFSQISFNVGANTLTVEGQANAETAPYFDYRVLEEFKKNTEMITYDYGVYVDSTGMEIPGYCITDINDSGDAYYSSYYSAYYAVWNFAKEGCNPSDLSRSEILSYDINPDTGQNDNEKATETECDPDDEDCEAESENEIVTEDESKTTAEDEESEGSSEIADDGKVSSIIIYRTPLFDEWYERGYLSTDGSVNGVPHFESQCLSYLSQENDDGGLTWINDNSCLAVPDGVSIIESSNAVDESDQLVLRFTAQMSVEIAMFKYENQFMLWFSPTGANVTDSFVQIADMFARRAEDCSEGDSTCENTPNETGGNE